MLLFQENMYSKKLFKNFFDLPIDKLYKRVYNVFKIMKGVLYMFTTRVYLYSKYSKKQVSYIRKLDICATKVLC